MKENQEYLEDLKAIRGIMQRSSNFISLSGISGILAGIYACIAAFVTYSYIYKHRYYYDDSILVITKSTIYKIIAIATVTLVLAISTGLIMAARKAKKKQQKIFDKSALLLVLHFLIPLVVGGAICLIFLWRGYLNFLSGFTLIFYGLALVSASKYTYKEVLLLGLTEILLGLITIMIPGYGLIFWVIGFGLMHILYGAIMHFKYER